VEMARYTWPIFSLLENNVGSEESGNTGNMHTRPISPAIPCDIT
jgi:hypothetical protein